MTNSIKILDLPISKFIDTRFRDYAIYVVSSRGIPSFYDGLTPVQRYILMNTPVNYTKTLSVIGRSIEDGYHHGDCLKYDTKINLADGTQITIGEWAEKFPDTELLVKSKDINANQIVTDIGHSPRIGDITNEYIQIELENGEIIECTEDHLFLVYNKWVKAKNLNIDDDISDIIKIKEIKRIKSKEPVKFYDITTESTHNFSICNSNIIVHNSSLQKAIAKLARPFGSAGQILEGYGFFGTEVSPDPAAARYTSVKLSSNTLNTIKEYKHLTTRIEDGPYMPLWMSIPLGLTSSIVGIAVGYKTTILPRKESDIRNFLDGKIDKLKPYFKDFGGSIKKYKDLENSWIITSKVNVDGNRIEIRELPPIMKYASALKKIDHVFNVYEGKIRILNNSNKTLSIDIIYRGNNSTEWKQIQDEIKKAFSIVVTENPVFIKDDQVLVYDNIEEYLKDYKWQLKRLDYKNKEYECNFLSDELKFNIAKKQFITFILEKKRTNIEIDVFLKPYDKDIKERLVGLTSRKFTKDELNITTDKIKELIIALKKKEKELNKSKIIFEKAKDPTLQRGVSSKRTKGSMFDADELEKINGITVWGGDDIIEDENEIEEFE